MRTFLVLSAAVLVSIGIGLGILTANGSFDANSLASVVLAASSKTADQGGVDLQISTTVTGLPGGLSVSATGTGMADLSTGESQAQLTFSGAGELNGLQLDELFVGGNVYLKIPQLEASLPADSWISVPAGKVSTSTNGVGLNPAAMMSLLEQRGATVSPIGQSSIDGSLDSGYSVQISTATLEHDLSAVQLPAAIQKQALLAISRTSGLSFKVWVTPQNELQQVTTTTSLALPAGGTAQVQSVVNLQDLGSAVDIAAPPSSQVISYRQFLSVIKQTAG